MRTNIWNDMPCARDEEEDHDGCSCATTFAYLSEQISPQIFHCCARNVRNIRVFIQSHCENSIPTALPTNVLASSLLCPVTISGRRSTEAMGTLQATMTTAMGPKPRKVRKAVASCVMIWLAKWLGGFVERNRIPEYFWYVFWESHIFTTSTFK